MRRRGGRLAASAQDEVCACLETVESMLPKRGKAAAGKAELEQALESLEYALDQHLGPYRKSWLREYVEAIAWAIGLALLIRSFIFEAFSIPSGSMIPTLEIGDRLFVNKVSYGLFIPFSANRLIRWSEPERGDVIVFTYRCAGDANEGEDYIKRIVADEGDRIRLDDNKLFVNGKPVDTRELGTGDCDIFEPDRTGTSSRVGSCQCVRQEEVVGETRYTTQHMVPNHSLASFSRCPNRPDWPLERPFISGKCRYFGEKASNPDWPDVVVPPDHVFVMGDNRDRSEDGRYWGLVHRNDIKGTAFVVWWPLDRFFTWLN